MPAIRNMQQIADDWKQSAQAATGKYTQGLRTPKRDWQDATEAATENWAAGVQNAVANNRFSQGVANSSTQRWQQGALTKGTQRWAPGIAASQEDYQRGFAPFHSVIQGTQLSPRGPKGSAQNYQRVQEMGMALHEAKQRGA